MMWKNLLTTMAALAAVPTALCAQSDNAAETTSTEFVRTQDIVYGREYGTALTMDLFEPVGKRNGAAVIWVISGGWYSGHKSIDSEHELSPVKPLIARGYKVYAVVHRSNPMFSIEDAVADVTRATRVIRQREDADKQTSTPIGIMGASAGGHLSLMMATTGDDGNPAAKDPVERAASRVQAAACYFPPTDFLNYGETNVDAYETSLIVFFQAPFEFKQYNDKSKTVDMITDRARLREILAEVSPITHVTPDDAPGLIIHGTADVLVPHQQAEVFEQKMKEAGAEVEVIIKDGLGHGWPGLVKDNETLYDWLDKHLLEK